MQNNIYGLELLPKAARSPVKKVIEKVLNASHLDTFRVEIALVDDKAMLRLQKEFKKKAHTTDVLSFPLGFPEKNFPHFADFLGEMVICLDQAGRQATEYGHTLEEEIAVLCAHGLMHLLGFDHERSIQEALKQMQGECLLLELAGIDPKFSLIGRSQ